MGGAIAPTGLPIPYMFDAVLVKYGCWRASAAVNRLAGSN